MLLWVVAFLEGSRKQARAGLLLSGINGVSGACQRWADKGSNQDYGKQGTSAYPMADTPADWRHSQKLTMVIVSGHTQKA
jgi:hypothetical protein